MNTYTVRRSKLALCIGYFLAEGLLLAFLAGIVFIWLETPSYLNWGEVVPTYIIIVLFFHFLLFMGTFYRVKIADETIEYHGLLRKTKKLHFSDIARVAPSGTMDMKIIGKNNKKLFCVKATDRNFNRFMQDIAAHTTGPAYSTCYR